MLADFQYAEDQVVKWFYGTVAQYLLEGSPVEGYTRGASHFTKSKRADIDVRKHFHNF